MTTAQAFAEYLGLTPEAHPWAFDYICPMCGDLSVANSNGVEAYECFACHSGFSELNPALTATSPLAPEPTAGWLEALIRRGFDLTNYGSHFEGSARECGVLYEVNAAHPTHAVARALMAADPELRAKVEACEDYREIVQ